MAEPAPELEVLAMSGLEGLLEGADFFAVAALELGELGGEGPDHAAWLVGAGCCGARCGCGLLPGPELFDLAPDLGSAVEEVQ
jgi:hypothetical protein